MTYRYFVFYKGKLVTRKISLAGAVKIKATLIREKGWKEQDIDIRRGIAYD